MRFVCAVVGFVATLAMGVQAQQGGVKLAPPPTHVVLIGDGCPGLLSAKRQSAGGMMWTVSREDSARPGAKTKAGNEGVYVTLKSARGALRGIELSVSYIAPGARVMPVGSPDAKDLLKKTFELSADGETNVDGNLLVGPAFEITSVHLMSATFADGSVWRAPSEDTCSVEPSKYMLVEAKR